MYQTILSKNIKKFKGGADPTRSLSTLLLHKTWSQLAPYSVN